MHIVKKFIEFTSELLIFICAYFNSEFNINCMGEGKKHSKQQENYV